MNSLTIKLLSKFPKNTKSINISNKNVSGLLDLSNYPHLTNLNCSNNLITKIKLYSNMEKINIKSNPIDDLYYSFEKKPKSYSKKLTKLTFGYLFDDSVDNLPSQLENLILGDDFSQ